MDKFSTKKMLTLEELLKTDYVTLPHGVPRWDLHINGAEPVRINGLPVSIDEGKVFKDFPATYWDDNEGEDGFLTFYNIYVPSEDDNIHHLLPEEIRLAKALIQLGEAMENYKMRSNELSIAKRDRQRKEEEAVILAKEENELASIAMDYQGLFLSMSEDDTFDSAFYKASRQGYETNFDDFTAVTRILSKKVPSGLVKPLIPKEQLKPILKEMTILYNLLSYIARVKKEETDLDDNIGDCLQEWEDFVDKFLK